MSYQVHNSRRIPPRVPQPRKRKERDDGSEQQQLGFRQPQLPSRSTTQPAVSSNRLLAGYMAYEFITRGTLLGQNCSALPAEPPRRGMKPVEARVEEAVKVGSGEGTAQDSYAEVAALLKTEGAHIPGVVNPTQLARWIQM